MPLLNIPYVNPPGPPSFRCSFITAQQGDLIGGWSENFWLTVGSLSLAVAACQNLYNALAKAKSQGVWMPFFRISTVGSNRQTIIQRYPGQVNTQGFAVNDTLGSLGPTVPTVKVLVQLSNATPNFCTKQWIGGIDASNFTYHGSYAPGNFSAAWNVIMGSLTTGGFQIRKVCPTNKPQNVQQFTISQTGLATYANHGLANGAIIRIGRFVNGLGVNGLWAISGVTTNTFQLNGIPNGQFAAVPQNTKTSYWMLYQYQMYGITATSFLQPVPPNNGVLRATEHRIGRPTQAYSGRRRRLLR